MRREGTETLQEAIEAEAKRDRERILMEAQSRVQVLRDQAEADAEKQRAQLIRDAETRAARMRQEATGLARLEAQGVRAAKREALLDDVFRQAACRLGELLSADDYRETVEDLVVDAVSHLGAGGELTILADMQTAAILDQDTLARLAEKTETKLSLGKPLAEGTGVVLQSEDGRLRYDNTLQSRLNRMRAELRASVYRVLMGDVM